MKKIKWFLIPILISVLLVNMLPASIVASSSWLSGWSYRKSHDLIGATDAGTGYQISIIVHSGSGVDSDADVYLDSHCTDFPNDIRFTDDDGTTELDHWCENLTADPAVFWVEVTDDLSNNQSICIYYGKSGAASASNGDNTFPDFFEDDWDDVAKLQIPTSTYDAFGLLIKTGDDEVIYFYRRGTSNEFDKGDVYKCIYTPSTDSWGIPALVYSDGTYDVRNVGGGVIGSHIYLFFERYNCFTSTDIDIGYIKSTDLTGSSWGNYAVIDTSPLTTGAPYGHIVPTSNSTTFLQPIYGSYDSTHVVEVLKTTDSGDSWSVGAVIYSGATYWCETCIDYIGDSKMIALARDNAGNYVGQSMSEDDGENWGTNEDHDDGVMAYTNLGESTKKKVPWIIYDSESGKVIAPYMDRYSPYWMKIAEADADTVYADPTGWGDQQLVHTWGNQHCGYPSIVKISSGRYFLVYVAEVSKADGFEWGSDGDPLSNAEGGIAWTIVANGDSKAEIDTSQYYQGVRSARLYRDGTNSPQARITQTPLTSDQFIEFNLRKDNTSYFSLYHGNGTHCIHVNIADDEKIYYYDGANHDTGASVTINTWYKLGIKNVDWAAHTYDIYLEDSLIQSGAIMRTYASHSGRITFYNAGGTSELWLDDVNVARVAANTYGCYYPIKWTRYGFGTLSVSSGLLTFSGSPGLKNADGDVIESIDTFNYSCRLRTRYKFAGAAGVFNAASIGLGRRSYDPISTHCAAIVMYSTGGGTYCLSTEDGSNRTLSSGYARESDYAITDILWESDQVKFIRGANEEAITTTLPGEAMPISFGGDYYGATVFEVYGDWFFISKYVDPEPAHGSWGSEVSLPAAPTNVAATDGDHTDKVVVTWTKSTGATGYKVYEGGNLLDTLGDVATYDDTAAPAPTITPGTASATDGSSTAYITLSISGESVANGSSRTYKVVAFNDAGDSPDSNTDTGYRGHGALTCQWQRSTGDSDDNYSNIDGATSSTYDDTEAPAPTITAGNATASDGTSTEYVTLTLSNHQGNNGDGRWFQSVLNAEGAVSQDSTADRGYRGTDTLGFQWWESATDSDADYSVIEGATTDPYNDTEGVVEPDGRYYLCAVNMTGAVSQNSTSDRGYKLAIVAPNVTAHDTTGITGILGILHGEIINTGNENPDTVGFEWGYSAGNYSYNWTDTGDFGLETFSHTITGLPTNTPVFWRAFAINSGGTGYSVAMNFTTLALPLAPTNFTITQVGYNSYNISWAMGAAASTTIVRASETGYPDGVAGGYPIYSGNSTWVIVTGLDSNMTTYYYRAWSENDYGYSLDYAEAILEDPLGITQLIFVLGLFGFALWKKGWLRTILSLSVIMWGAFAMPCDVKIAAPLVAVGTILFVISILNIIKGGDKWYSEIPLVYRR